MRRLLDRLFAWILGMPHRDQRWPDPWERDAQTWSSIDDDEPWPCLNVLHNDIDCPTSGLFWGDWCDPCRAASAVS